MRHGGRGPGVHRGGLQQPPGPRRRGAAAAGAARSQAQPTIEELARDGYAAYGDSAGNKNYRGDPMPSWDQLGPAIQGHWLATAARIAARVAASLRTTRDAPEVDVLSELPLTEA